MRLPNKILLFGLFAWSSFLAGKSVGQDIPDGTVVVSASEPLKFYKVDLDKLLPIPDSETKQALLARTNCGQVRPRPVKTLTPAEQQSYTIGPTHRRLRVIQDKTIKSDMPRGTVRHIIIPDGWVYDDSCVYPWRYAQQHYGRFQARTSVALDQTSHRQYVIFKTIIGGGVCNVFIRPSGSPPIERPQ
jgi:hypothetical protein